MVTLCCRGAKKSAAPVGKSVGNAQEMVNSFTGLATIAGQLTCGEVNTEQEWLKRFSLVKSLLAKVASR